MKKLKHTNIKYINFPAMLKIILGKSNLKLANDLNISSTYYCFLVNEKRKINDINLIQKFSDYLNISNQEIKEILSYFENLNKSNIEKLLKYKLALSYLIKKIYPNLIIPNTNNNDYDLKTLSNLNSNEINIFKLIRLSNGMSIKDISDSLNFTYQYICMIENSKRNFPLDNYILFLSKFGYCTNQYIQILKLHDLIINLEISEEEKNILFLLGILKIDNPNLDKINDKILTKKR